MGFTQRTESRLTDKPRRLALLLTQVSLRQSPLPCRIIFAGGLQFWQVPKRLKRTLVEVLQCHMANLGCVDLKCQPTLSSSNKSVDGLSEYGTITMNQSPLTRLQSILPGSRLLRRSKAPRLRYQLISATQWLPDMLIRLDCTSTSQRRVNSCRWSRCFTVTLFSSPAKSLFSGTELTLVDKLDHLAPPVVVRTILSLFLGCGSNIQLCFIRDHTT